MKIMYIGKNQETSNSRLKAEALKRVGHSVEIADPWAHVKPHLDGKFRSALHYRSGYRFLQPVMRLWVKRLLSSHPPVDGIWVEGGELMGAGCAAMFTAFAPTMLSTTDDPTGRRDFGRFGSLIRAVPQYDLCMVTMDKDPAEFKAIGCRRLLQAYMAYDEITHKPYEDLADVPSQYRSEVAFVGTWIPGEGRDRFVHELAKRGIPVSVWGDAWQKSPLWKEIRALWRGPALYGRDYVAVIRGAKVMLGMLSHQNRDLHTKRSVEVPYAGGLLCAERTSRHLELYEHGKEAYFWSSVDECAEHCSVLLRNDGLREAVRLAGMEKVRSLGVGNENMTAKAVEALLRSRQG